MKNGRMKIGLVDGDGKLPNIVLMKISSFYKMMGDQVEWAVEGRQYDIVYASVLFTWNKHIIERLKTIYGDTLVVGGTGYDFEEINGQLVKIHHTQLPEEIEKMKPDYSLYTLDMILHNIRGGVAKKETKIKKAQTIIDMGIGFTSRGCVRACGFCIVYRKEGKFRQVAEIKDIVRPGSNVLCLLDNNLTADPDCIDKLKEIKDRNLIVDITQGVDARLLDDEKAYALNQVKHLRSLHFAWDLIESEQTVLRGINILKQYINPRKLMSFMLVGYNTSFEQDMYRFIRLREENVDPYVMIYNKNIRGDKRLQHFARWVNGRFYKSCTFEEYTPWVKIRESYYGQINMFAI